MKTARELLLNRHRKAGPSLDRLRMEVVQDLAFNQARESRSVPHRSSGFVCAAWQELFVACRRYWMGLGAVWCAIVFLAVSGAEEGPDHARPTTMRREVVVQAMRDQQEMRRELLDLEFTQQARAEPRDVIPGPRSEVTVEFANV